MKTVTAARYLTPLREGGSLPAIIEADDGELYVMKFVGAGQGRKALIAELVAGALGQTLGLPVPDVVIIELDPALGPSEPDPEIHDLLRFSIGLNLGARFLPHAFAYNPLLPPHPSPELASAIVWFDAYLTNVDRTPRNTNILISQGKLWLIDHGACLYFHHDWKNYMERSRTPFPQIKDHTLLRFAGQLDQADATLKPRLTDAVLRAVIDLIPEVWLVNEPTFTDPAEHRAAYVAYLTSRRAASPVFVEEAKNAQAQLV
ncbi:MAG: aminotransferase class I and II [Chloroflexi bacterium]|nr:aminotransferase class I and II [Chloroflexota bacterium]